MKTRSIHNIHELSSMNKLNSLGIPLTQNIGLKKKFSKAKVYCLGVFYLKIWSLQSNQWHKIIEKHIIPQADNNQLHIFQIPYLPSQTNFISIIIKTLLEY